MNISSLLYWSVQLAQLNVRFSVRCLSSFSMSAFIPVLYQGVFFMWRVYLTLLKVNHWKNHISRREIRRWPKYWHKISHTRLTRANLCFLNKVSSTNVYFWPSKYCILTVSGPNFKLGENILINKFKVTASLLLKLCLGKKHLQALFVKMQCMYCIYHRDTKIKILF